MRIVQEPELHADIYKRGYMLIVAIDIRKRVYVVMARIDR